MDKYEYKIKAEEIEKLAKRKEYDKALVIADTIDWRRVKNVVMLNIVAEIYKINRRYDDCKEVLLIANERHPNSRFNIYSLCEVCTKAGHIVEALEYYKEFVRMAPNDANAYILKYRIYQAQDVTIEERIQVLEEFMRKESNPTEKWCYELAYLYHQVGLSTRCVEECDSLILLFGRGKYVMKAMELKMLHESLTPAQLDKYNRNKVLMQKGQDIEEDFEGDSEQESEIQVKTVDVGQYNTTNLQQEIAASMQELMTEESMEEEQPVEKVSSHTQAIQTVIGPLLEDTVEITKVNTGIEKLEEIYFEEHQEEFSEEFQEEQEIPEIEYGQKIRITEDSIDSSEDESDGHSDTSSEEELVLLREVESYVEMEDTDDPAMKEVKFHGAVELPEETEEPAVMVIPESLSNESYAKILVQEYDGQISLAVPESEQVEKQITGQLCINDILLEWEQMKKENEEKRKEEMRQRVLEQTSDMFSEFDAAAKRDVLEELNRLAEETQLEEVDELEEVEEIEEVEELEEVEEIEEVDELEEAEEIEEVDELEEAEELEELEEVEETEGEVEATEDVKEPVDKEHKALLERFGRFPRNRKQILDALDGITMASHTGNVMITCDDKAEGLTLATELLREVQAMDHNFQGKIARISGGELNQKDLEVVFEKLVNCALIIEKAQELSTQTVTTMLQCLDHDEQGIIVILICAKHDMEKLQKRRNDIRQSFNLQIDIEELNNKLLAKHGIQYALEKEFTIDELGLLALHERIAERQTNSHQVTLQEVEEIIDQAIEHAEHKSFGHFLDVVLGKRYDEEDMIILKENDF